MFNSSSETWYFWAYCFFFLSFWRLADSPLVIVLEDKTEQVSLVATCSFCPWKQHRRCEKTQIAEQWSVLIPSSFTTWFLHQLSDINTSKIAIVVSITMTSLSTRVPGHEVHHCNWFIDSHKIFELIHQRPTYKGLLDHHFDVNIIV